MLSQMRGGRLVRAHPGPALPTHEKVESRRGRWPQPRSAHREFVNDFMAQNTMSLLKVVAG